MAIRATRRHLITVLTTFLLVGKVSADTTTQPYNIPAQPLNSALMGFATDANLELLYNADQLRGLHFKGLNGSLTPRQALDQLLQGSGYTYHFIDNRTVTLEKAPTPPASQLNQVEQTTLPAVKVVGSAVYDVKDPYNPDYVMPNATSGTKTDTPIMETPLNVQVISKQVMKDQQVINLSDALKNVSGVTTTANSGGTNDNTQVIFLRGFSSSTYFRNGFRLTEGASLRDMSNVESVEVAKGPAAILYGMVEPGGMVNVITKQPLETPYYALNQQFGSFANFRTTIDTSGPLTKDDTLLYRVNASYQNSGSFQDFVKNEDFFIAPILKWNISSRTQATVEFEYNHKNLVENYGFRPMINGQVVDLSRRLNYGEAAPTYIDTFYGGFNWSHAFNDDWQIKHHLSINQTARNVYTSNPQSVADTTITRVPVVANNQSDTYATGIDLTGHFKTFVLEHTLLFGGDYYRTQGLFAASFKDDGAGGFLTDTIDALNPVHTGFSAAGFKEAYRYITTNDQYGAYIQDQIKLPYEVHVMGGIRYQNFHQGILGPDSTALSQDAVTPRVGILWQPQHWLSLYANYVESFGPNSGRIYKSLTESTNVPATSANQYEGGIKTEFYDGRLRANLAYFDLTKTNITTPDRAHPNFVLVTGAAQSRGYEFDVTGEILPGWNAIATYSNTDVKVIKSNTEVSGGGALAAGSRFWGVPRNTASLWNTYEFQQGNLLGLKFGGGVTLRSGQLACCDEPMFSIPGYATVDLLAAYSRKVGKSKVTVQLNVNNLLDKYYYTGLQTLGPSFGSNAAFLDFGTPRSVMGSIGVQF